MARSEEALQRRAEKRQRSVEEQKQVDVQDMKRPKLPPPMAETGAWTCPQCNNHNFASRRVCNSKTCDQARPAHIPIPPRRSRDPHQQQHGGGGGGGGGTGAGAPSWKCECGQKNYASRDHCFNNYCQRPRPESAIKKKKKPRHDETTSKTLVWANQADDTILTNNQELRKRYQETKGEGMEPEDIERAKVLISRDERRRQKRGGCSKTQPEEAKETPEAAPEPTPTPPVEKEKKSKKEDSKSKRDKNKALRTRYIETRGAGMKPEQVERAKQLIERDERKRRKRELAEAEKGTESPQ